MKIFPFVFLACYSLASELLLADEPLKRHGTVTESDTTVQLQGGFTGTVQTVESQTRR